MPRIALDPAALRPLLDEIRIYLENDYDRKLKLDVLEKGIAGLAMARSGEG